MQSYENALSILKVLDQNKYESFLVGGCVRDMLLSKKPLDYDITTNALPEVIEALFDRTVPTGKDFGTITVIIDHVGYETTTYRLETEYTDGRRPKSISYATQLVDDLSRRDFTINAIAMDLNGNTYDYFGGKEDLNNKIIRTIGDPNLRFAEDYLRMLRAIRFSSVLDFEIEIDTFKAIQKNCDKIQYTSSERVRDELNKILISNKPSKGFILLQKSGLLKYILPEVEKCYGFEVNSHYHDKNVFDHTMHVLDNTRPELELRLAALLHDISKTNLKCKDENGMDYFPNHQYASAEICRHILFRLKYSKKAIYHIVKLVEHHQHRELDLNPVNIKILIRYLDIRLFPSLIELMEADIRASRVPYDFTTTKTLKAVYNEVIDHNHPVLIKDLAINGNDIKRFGYKNKEIGDKLQFLLDHVLIFPKDNNRLKLMELLSSK